MTFPTLTRAAGALTLCAGLAAPTLVHAATSAFEPASTAAFNLLDGLPENFDPGQYSSGQISASGTIWTVSFEVDLDGLDAEGFSMGSVSYYLRSDAAVRSFNGVQVEDETNSDTILGDAAIPRLTSFVNFGARSEVVLECPKGAVIHALETCLHIGEGSGSFGGANFGFADGRLSFSSYAWEEPSQNTGNPPSIPIPSGLPLLMSCIGAIALLRKQSESVIDIRQWNTQSGEQIH